MRGGAARAVARRHFGGQQGLVGVGAKEEDGQWEGGGAARTTARRHRRGQRGLVGVGAKEEDDNYGGGDDHYGSEVQGRESGVGVGLDDNYCE